MLGELGHFVVPLVAVELGRTDKDKTRLLHKVCAVIEINEEKHNESLMSQQIILINVYSNGTQQNHLLLLHS